ncbi:MAG: glycosyltransferase [Treponema sp.]|nr:glycosyltransferase [Treponema sp.]
MDNSRRGSAPVNDGTGGREKNFVSAVVYVHNAEDRVAEFLKAVGGVLEDNFEKSEIVCVNDFSDDGSVQKIKDTGREFRSTCVSTLNMSSFHGVELAMTAGVDLAIGDFVFEFDSTLLDFSSDEIMCVYRKSLEGFDIVSACPDKARRASSSLFYLVFNRFSHLDYKMTTERFRILSRRVINRVQAMNKAMPYRKPVYAACGLKTASLSYRIVRKIRERDDSFTRSYRKSLAVDSLIIFTDLGYRVSMLITGAMLVFSIAVGVYSFAFYALRNPVPGWTSTILFLSVSMFFIFMILTIVIKYLQILVNLVFKKARYNFESIEKLTK